MLQQDKMNQQEIGLWWELIAQRQLITQGVQLNSHLIAFLSTEENGLETGKDAMASVPPE